MILDSLNVIRLVTNRVPGVRFVELVGRNPDIDLATVPESVWAAGGVIVQRTTAAVVELISSSVEDDPDKGAGVPGTGTHSVTIYGLDANWNEIKETVALNGTAAVTSVKEFLRINFAETSTTGSSLTNAGDITLRNAGAGNTQRFITAGRGHTEAAIYSVPAGHTLVLDGWYLTARDASGASAADVDTRVRHNAQASVDHIEWTTVVDKVFSPTFGLLHPFEEKTDIEMRVTSVGANNTVVTFHGHALLIGPNADI
jgi:hypothetical protein